MIDIQTELSCDVIFETVDLKPVGVTSEHFSLLKWSRVTASPFSFSLTASR